MKKIIVLLLSTCFLSILNASAQIELGIRGGVVSSNFNINDYSKEIEEIKNGEKEVGFHIGTIMRISSSTKKFIFELDPTFVNTRSSFTLTKASIINEVFEDKQWRMDVPIMFGTQFAGFLDLMAGPSLSLNIGNSLSYKDIDESIEQNYKSTTWGYQLGASIKIARIIIDARYVGSLQSITKGIRIGDTFYETDTRPSSVTASLSILF